MNDPPRVDPEFGGPPPDFVVNRARRAYHDPKGQIPFDKTIDTKAREQVEIQMGEIRSPITDEFGSYKTAPSEPELYKKAEKVAKEHGVPSGLIVGYIHTTTFPDGRSSHQNWNGGYGLKALGALHHFERQLNFFKKFGMTPSEAIESTYQKLIGMKTREDEVGSALGFQKPKLTYEQRLAELEEADKKALLLSDNNLRYSIQRQKGYLKEEFGRGGRKSRKSRKSKKSRTTRRTRRSSMK